MKWIYHEREARVIYSLTTERQPVIYWATYHLLARLYSGSNTQETTRRQVYPSDDSNLPPLHEKKVGRKPSETDPNPPRIMTANTELNDLRRIICLRKYEVSVERISVCNVIKNLAEHGIHYLPCSYTNGVKKILP